jgi:hypothetical protein
MKLIMYYALFYSSWIMLHFAASHFYTTHCTPLTIQGLFLSPFQVMTPQCTGARWIVNNGGNNINFMWMTLGTYLAALLIRPFRE